MLLAQAGRKAPLETDRNERQAVTDHQVTFLDPDQVGSQQQRQPAGEENRLLPGARPDQAE